MIPLFRSLALLAAIAGSMAATGLSLGPVQGQDKDAKADPPEAKKTEKKTEEPGVVEVYMAKDGWRFRIKNAEGKSIAIGTVGFASKDDALRAIEMVKATLATGKVVEVPGSKK